jgi:hypothetical protein
MGINEVCWICLGSTGHMPYNMRKLSSTHLAAFTECAPSAAAAARHAARWRAPALSLQPVLWPRDRLRRVADALARALSDRPPRADALRRRHAAHAAGVPLIRQRAANGRREGREGVWRAPVVRPPARRGGEGDAGRAVARGATGRVAKGRRHDLGVVVGAVDRAVEGGADEGVARRRHALPAD